MADWKYIEHGRNGGTTQGDNERIVDSGSEHSEADVSGHDCNNDYNYDHDNYWVDNKLGYKP